MTDEEERLARDHAYPPADLEGVTRALRRIVDPNAGRRKCLSPESECRLCRARRGLERHHLVPRSQQGDDVDANLVPLCGAFENGCHLRITQGDPDARRALRSALWPEEELYVAHKMGWGWLETRLGVESEND